MTISLRPIEPADERFLYAVYASTRTEELAPVPWTDEQKAAFLWQQFTAQHRHYQEHYGDARFEIILRDGEPVGRLYVARWPAEIRIVDISILPAHRNAGIGGRLLRELLAEGEASGKTVSIHVERFNPAMRLYQRLGFREVADLGVYFTMKWTPSRSSPPSP
jgi:RimJ/RimL family protein N-acetyltransferase